MKNILLFIISLLISFSVAAQSFIGKSPLRSPTEYEKPKLNIKIGKFRSGRNIWTVWADRDGVISSNGKQLEFAARFLVVGEDNDRLHIINENGTYNSTLNQFVGEPIDYGWVPKSSMLLWSTALYSDITNFRIKVMTITTPSLMISELQRIKTEGKNLNFYSNPTTTVENNNGLPLFEIFYVFKKEGTRLLLGRRDNIAKGNAAYYLMGWVDESKVQLWEMRQVLEPDWNKGSSDERRTNKTPAALFGDPGHAITYGNTGDTTDNYWSDDRFEKRYDPTWKRLPVFSLKENLIETAVVSDLVNETGKTVDEESQRKLKLLEATLRERRRNINVVFVIDGTESMAPYFKSVQTAVKNSAMSLYNEDNKYRFGAIVYRDYIDPSNDKCYNIIPLGNSPGRFSELLEGCNTNNPLCFDKTLSEGLYLGLDKARSLFRGKENETNVIILIGDAADREGMNRVSQSDVIPGLVKNRINMICIQVNHGLGQTYEDFILEVPGMILKTSMKIVAEDTATNGRQQVLSSLLKPRWKQESTSEIGFFTLQNSPLTGGMQYVSLGKSISVARTSSIIEGTLKEMNRTTDNLLKVVNDVTNSIINIDASKIGSFAPAVKLFLKDAGYTNDQLELLTQKNYQFLLKTYTSLEVKKLKNPVYKFDIFLDSEELNDLIVTLNKVYTPGLTSSERRQSFRDAWFEILRVNYGVSREEIKSKTFSEVMRLVSGLPSPNPILKRYTLNDIMDITRLPDMEFDQILGSIKEKSDLLTKIAGNRQFYFMSNDRAYYWIPQSYLP